MTDIAMPKLSDSMEEGTIVSWLKAHGDTVAAGEELVEIETDKATTTYEAPQAGTLQIVAATGQTLPVGAVIARVGKAAEALAAAATPGAAAPAPEPAAPAPAPVPNASPDGEGRRAAVAATPMARRLAAAYAIDLAALVGTGPRGRVTRADVAAAAGIAVSPAATTAPLAAPPATTLPAAPMPATGGPAASALMSTGDVSVHALTRAQQTVARRMAEANATIPEFQVQTEVAMDAALALRGRLQALGGEVVPSVNDLIVKASALALREHPRANGSYQDDRFELHSRINVGIAVAAQDALLVPTITDADMRSLGSIAAEARRLAARVRDGSITPLELSGGTFTVSNLGMYGMTAISPVINMPQAAILGAGATRATLARGEDGEIVDRRLMTLTLTCDHRILYGADAAHFLATIRDLLEQPLRLVL